MRLSLSVAATMLILVSSSNGAEKHSAYDPPVDLREQYSQYRERAQAGDMEAVARVGYSLLRGVGVDRDELEGLKLIRMAAANGNAIALYQLSRVYHFGVVGQFSVIESRDEQKSVAYRDKYYTAIDAGIENGVVHPASAMSYARALERGNDGVKQDLEGAKEVYNLAIEKLEDQSEGDVDALLELAQIYHSGRAMRFENPEVARGYMKRALATGHPNAWYSNARMLEDEDEIESNYYMQKAAQAGHYEAMLSLAHSEQSSVPEKILLREARYDQKASPLDAVWIAGHYEDLGNEEGFYRWSLRALYGGNGSQSNKFLRDLYHGLVERSGARDLVGSHEAYDKAWVSMLESDVYAKFYYRGREIGQFCEKTEGSYDNSDYCSVQTFIEGRDKPM